jgi:predicted  nucleic acid-binding Zn-ribbon protein
MNTSGVNLNYGFHIRNLQYQQRLSRFNKIQNDNQMRLVVNMFISIHKRQQRISETNLIKTKNKAEAVETKIQSLKETVKSLKQNIDQDKKTIKEFWPKIENAEIFNPADLIAKIRDLQFGNDINARPVAREFKEKMIGGIKDLALSKYKDLQENERVRFSRDTGIPIKNGIAFFPTKDVLQNQSGMSSISNSYLKPFLNDIKSRVIEPLLELGYDIGEIGLKIQGLEKSIDTQTKKLKTLEESFTWEEENLKNFQQNIEKIVKNLSRSSARNIFREDLHW